MAREWKIIFKKISAIRKTGKKWDIAGGGRKLSPSDVFLESLGDRGTAFFCYRKAGSEKEKGEALKEIAKLNGSVIWRAETRGTVHHYHHFFPDDENLSFWSNFMKSI